MEHHHPTMGMLWGHVGQFEIKINADSGNTAPLFKHSVVVSEGNQTGFWGVVVIIGHQKRSVIGTQLLSIPQGSGIFICIIYIIPT